MSKKKNKIAKITDEQYLQYIAGLKNDAALFSATGELTVPNAFDKSDKKDDEKE